MYSWEYILLKRKRYIIPSTNLPGDEGIPIYLPSFGFSPFLPRRRSLVYRSTNKGFIDHFHYHNEFRPSFWKGMSCCVWGKISSLESRLLIEMRRTEQKKKHTPQKELFYKPSLYFCKRVRVWLFFLSVQIRTKTVRTQRVVDHMIRKWFLVKRDHLEEL